MQNTKDTFYEVLRGRIAAGNPERTIVLRGVTRPGVLVEENELVTTSTIPDCFRLRWAVTEMNAEAAMPLAVLRCEILYETAGTALNGGMDRGRALSAMDAELAAVINTYPQFAAKQSYAALANGGTASAMNTNLWWADVEFGATELREESVGRTATVKVMCCEEAGEL